MRRKQRITYPDIVGNRLSKIFQRKLQPQEWGILYGLIGKYGRDPIDESLDAIEDGEIDFTVVRITTFKTVVEQMARDYVEVIKESQDIKKAVSETKDAQKKGQELLEDLI